MISKADTLLSSLKHAEYVKTLSSFIRSNVSTDETSSFASPKTRSALTICFACGGSAKRWQEFLGVKKYLVDIGETLPLLYHSISSFDEAINPEFIVVLVDPKSAEELHCECKVRIVARRGDAEDDVAIEVLSNPEIASPNASDVLLLMGDVAWSRESVSIVSEYARCRRELMLFGRSKKNDFYGNTGGEIFGAYIPSSERAIIEKFYSTCKQLYYGNNFIDMPRFSTWETLALVTAAGKISGGQSLEVISSVGYGISELTELMKSSLTKGEFLGSIWTEINDETEDFDFPFEYLRFLRRKASAFMD